MAWSMGYIIIDSHRDRTALIMEKISSTIFSLTRCGSVVTERRDWWPRTDRVGEAVAVPAGQSVEKFNNAERHGC